MGETVDQRTNRQFMNYQWRLGPKARGADLITWSVPFRESIIMDQALDQRSQFEWFAQSDPPLQSKHQEPE